MTTYRVSRVKIRYDRANDVLQSEEVADTDLFAELEARGVQRRLFSYRDGTSQTVNGEFTRWEAVPVAETWDVRNSTQENLEAFAGIMADALRTNLVPVRDALVPLHHAALELNRRHGNASLQGPDVVPDAIETLRQIDLLLTGLCGDEDIDWAAMKLARLRAFGVLIDQADAEAWMESDYSPEDVREALHGQAITEGRRRGFEHAPNRVAVLVPTPDAVVPF